MIVRTLQSLTTPRGKIPAGKIITIPDHLAERLKGKVEPIIDTSPFRGAVEIVTDKDERVWIVTDPDTVNLIPPGAVFFLEDEIMQLQNGGKEAAKAALMVKQVFGNDAKVTESVLETSWARPKYQEK